MLRTTSEGRRGGLEFALSLTADQTEALGSDAVELMEQMDTALVALAIARTGQRPKVWLEEAPPSLKDQTYGPDWEEWVMQDVSAILHRLGGLRDAAIRSHVREGGSYGRLARALGTRRATAQYRRDSLPEEGQETPPEIWARGLYGHVAARANVPPELEPWTVPWPGYTPPDVTEPGLRTREALEQSHAEWGAELALTPYDIPGDELIARRSDAWIPYEHDHRRWPLHPWGRRGVTGRRMRKWDENKMVDAIVVAGDGDDRQVLAIWRSDNGRVALPGGHLDDGESALTGALRELEEETGVVVGDDASVIPLERRIVDDHRATDHAWPVTAPFLIRLDKPVPATAADDATHAEWLPFATMETLEQATDGNLFVGHRPILQAAYEYLTD